MPAENSPTASDALDASAVSLRAAVLSDAPRILQLVADSGVLDSNSCYCYLLLCRDFADTCVVACCGDQLAGFVTAYRPPQRREAIFVWQVGVAPSARRQGLAKRMLHALIAMPACREVHYLEATVTPSNAASRRLFQSFADDLKVPCQTEQGFTAEMFGFGDHEPEDCFRIGPFADSP